MIPGLSPTGIIKQVATSLVAKQRYSTLEEAIWELALSSVRSKTAFYRRRIRKLENKYGTDFNKFTVRLKNQATPAEEDDWLAWRSALSMLADWQKAYQDLIHESPC
jgi:hypothetical protein